MALIRIVSDIPPTTLDATINASVTSLDVASGDGASFGAAPFQIAIAEEAMLVTGVSTDTFTVTRGYAGTAGAAHTAGDDLVHAHSHLDFPFRRDDSTGDYQLFGAVDIDMNANNLDNVRQVLGDDGGTLIVRPGTARELLLKDDDGSTRFRVMTGGDMEFRKDDGTTTSLYWDESDDRWEMTTNLDMSNNQIVAVQELGSLGTDLFIDAENVGAAAQDIYLRTDDAAGVQRNRIWIDGDGSMAFYDKAAALTAYYDDGNTRWQYDKNINMGGSGSEITSVNQVSSWSTHLLLHAINAGAAPADIFLSADDSGGVLRTRIWIDGDGDLAFYDAAGALTANYDDANARWEYGTDIDLSGNFLTSAARVTTWDTDLWLAAISSSASAQDIWLKADDAGGVQRNRIFIDGDGSTFFYDNAGAIVINVSATSVAFNQNVNINSNFLTNPLDPTAGSHVGDRDYNDLRYADIASEHVKYTDAEAAAKIALDDLYVKIAGDTMGGDLDFNHLYDVNNVARVYGRNSAALVVQAGSGQAVELRNEADVGQVIVSATGVVTLENDAGAPQFRLPATTGDIQFRKLDGTTTSLLWDESDDQWEFTTNVDMGGNLFSATSEISSWDTDLTLRANNSGATAQDFVFIADDGGGVPRTRLLIDGDGGTTFYDLAGATRFLVATNGATVTGNLNFTTTGTVYALDGDISLRAQNSGAADRNIGLYADDAGGVARNRIWIDGGGAASISDNTGTERFRVDTGGVEMSGSIDMDGNALSNVQLIDGVAASHVQIQADTGYETQLRDDAGVARVRVAPTSSGDIWFADSAGTTQFWWDHSATLFKFQTGISLIGGGTLDFNTGQLWDVGNISAVDTTMTLRAINSGAAIGGPMTFNVDDAGGVERQRFRILGSGDINFYKVDGSTGSLTWDESLDKWNLGADVDVNGHILQGVLDPTGDGHVGDRGYNDARYVEILGDTMTGDLSIVKTDANLTLSDTGAAGQDANVKLIYNDLPAGDYWKIGGSSGNALGAGFFYYDDSLASLKKKIIFMPNETAQANDGDIIFYDEAGTETQRWDESANAWEYSRDVDMKQNDILSSTGPFFIGRTATTNRLAFDVVSGDLTFYDSSNVKALEFDDTDDSWETTKNVVSSGTRTLTTTQHRNVYVGTSAPGSPDTGDLWLDTT